MMQGTTGRSGDMEERILETVKRLEGPRDGDYYYGSLMDAADYIESTFRLLGLDVTYDEFDFNDRAFRNIIATTSRIEDHNDWVVVCAHYDSVAGSPGADDNASGVAVMLEAARSLAKKAGLMFVAFTLEEPQASGFSFLYGSRHFVRKMKTAGQRYKAVFNLESVGYISNKPGSQTVPSFVKAPDVGDFIALVGNNISSGLMSIFEETAKKYVPELNIFTHKALMNGYLFPATRFSDHAPFWDAGYPAIMITDTAMLRNPNYHTSTDTSDTLAPEFMARVAKALIHTLPNLLQEQG